MSNEKFNRPKNRQYDVPKDGECECCLKKIKNSVELELSLTDGEYYYNLPAHHKSQGCFNFGPTCAKKIAVDELAKNGDAEQIKEKKLFPNYTRDQLAEIALSLAVQLTGEEDIEQAKRIVRQEKKLLNL